MIARILLPSGPVELKGHELLKMKPLFLFPANIFSIVQARDCIFVRIVLQAELAERFHPFEFLSTMAFLPATYSDSIFRHFPGLTSGNSKSSVLHLWISMLKSLLNFPQGLLAKPNDNHPNPCLPLYFPRE